MTLRWMMRGTGVLVGLALTCGGCGNGVQQGMASATSDGASGELLSSQSPGSMSGLLFGSLHPTTGSSRSTTGAGLTSSGDSTANPNTNASTDGSSDTSLLSLTADQLAQARELIDALRGDLADLRSAARDDVRAVLTDAQRATLDLVRPPVEIQSEEDAADATEAKVSGECGSSQTALWGRTDASLGMGYGFFGGNIVDALGLTQEQQDAIETILETQRTAIADRYAQLGTDLRAILTADQLAAFDAWISSYHSWGFMHMMGGRPGAPADGHPGPFAHRIELTDDQRTQAETIFSQLRADTDAAIGDARDELRALLTDAQLTTLDALDSPDRGHWHWGGLPDGLADSLALTAEQSASIDERAEALRATLKDLREAARADFQAILTTDQLDQMTEWDVVRLLLATR